VVLIDAATLLKAERLVASCERCNPEGSEIPFEAVLDDPMGIWGVYRGYAEGFTNRTSVDA